MRYKSERALTLLHRRTHRPQAPVVERRYKSERALTHKYVDTHYNLSRIVERRYKPERALTHREVFSSSFLHELLGRNDILVPDPWY